MNVLLIGNYPLDKQESMLRFALMMKTGLEERENFEVRILQPKSILAKFFPKSADLQKWLGYIDKFLLFPAQLKAALPWADVVHICDHSNAIYTSYLQKIPHIVTCHDLLAIRGALGEDTDCPASATGKILQHWILNGLKKARLIACDSSYTRADAIRLLQGAVPEANIRLVLLGMNHCYQVLPEDEVNQRLAVFEELPLSYPYLLHVGSSLPRKNRDGILRIFHRIRNQWPGYLVFAGQKLSAELEHLVQELSLGDRVIQLAGISNEQLEALYNRAFALLFPSRSEGFGWPVIEAQACGCPVLCSDRCSVPEVAGSGAMIIPIEDEETYAAKLLSLQDPDIRQHWIQAGFDNLSRFENRLMIDRYIALYQAVQSSV
jgi:glycosyltransferase involved in cell wall biosynthesis